MEGKKILLMGDGILETGFGRVLHSIAKFLYNDYKYSISWLGLNYDGDPHDFPYRMYPAKSNTSLYGFDRTPIILQREQPDLIFILNDVWIVDQYLEYIKKFYGERKRPPIVVYFPVDAEDHDIAWYKHFDIVDLAVTYTNFGKEVATQAAPGIDFKIMPHGVDSEDFFKIDMPIKEIRRQLFPHNPELMDTFIFLNANRNQPRKRLDITLQAFSLFSRDKPENVKLYLHCGVEDKHINTLVLAERYNIDKRLILSGKGKGIQRLPISTLNVIYNATDVGINTGIGEGWGLTSVEHAVTGAPQIVPAHSACKELFSECGVLVPPSLPSVIEGICTTGYEVRPDDVAKAMDIIYTNRQLYNQLSVAGYKKFTDEAYSWKKITEQWNTYFEELLNNESNVSK